MNKFFTKKFLAMFILSTLALLDLKAQDAIFSQFYNASLYLNPALAGDEENIVLNTSYRSQWSKIHFPYTTAQASVIVPYYKNQHRTPQGHKGGFGVSMFNDVAGINSNFKTLGGSLSYAYNILLDRKASNKLSFAIQSGFIQKTINTDNLEWGEQYQPFLGFNKEITPLDAAQVNGRTYLDMNAGVFWRYQAPGKIVKGLIRSVYSGLSVAHLNHPNESVISGESERLPVLYKYHGGFVFSLSRQASISANVLTMLQDKQNQTNVGSYFTYALPIFGSQGHQDFLFRVGGWYRLKDSFIGNLELVMNKFKIGFSYDWNVSSLRYNTSRGVGSYEISLGLNFRRFAPPKVRY